MTEKNKKRLILGLLLFITAGLWSCGKGVVEINEKNYQPKIVIEGYLYPHKAVQRLKITRNFPLDTPIRRDELPLAQAVVTLIDLKNTNSYSLAFDPLSKTFFTAKNRPFIEYGNSYQLNVTAHIDGRTLQAQAVTRVPLAGFDIVPEGTSDSLFYLQHDASGNLLKPHITFKISPRTNFYGFSIAALDTLQQNFIFPPSNPFLPLKFGKKQYTERFTNLIYSRDQIFDILPESGQMRRDLEWFHFMFYGRYRVVAYAGDDNMKDYYFTFKMVTEMDGNLHEPVMHIQGDGIGIFGSAIADTLFLKIKRPAGGF